MLSEVRDNARRSLLHQVSCKLDLEVFHLQACFVAFPQQVDDQDAFADK